MPTRTWGRDLDNTVYALDASTIDLCLSAFPWTLFRSTESAIKLQTLLVFKATSQPLSTSLTASYTTSISLICCPGAFYIMDRGHVDFERLFTLHRTGVSSSSAPSPLPNTGVATLIPGTNPVVFEVIGPLR